MKLEVPIAVLTRMIAHVDDSLPNEACGLLFGQINDSFTQFIAQELRTFKNVSERPKTSFLIDPEALYKSLCVFEKKQMVLVAIYHSHRAPPALSHSDRHYMEGYPGIVWLIFSTLSHSQNFPFAAFILKQNVVSPVTVQIL